MTAYVIEVHLEHLDQADEVHLYGTYRSQRRAVEDAAKIASKAGLNRNNFGSWSGTDGIALFAFVRIVPIVAPNPVSLGCAAGEIRDHFINNERNQK